MQIGDPAPDFELPDSDGGTVRLRDLRGRPVVIAFYPRDESPGCTQQACDIRDSWALFKEAGAAVLGISPDTVESHRSFKDSHDLPHTLLADPEREVIERYEVWGTVRLGDRVKDSVIRSTFLVDAEGTLVDEWRGINPATHADEVLRRLKELPG